MYIFNLVAMHTCMAILLHGYLKCLHFVYTPQVNAPKIPFLCGLSGDGFWFDSHHPLIFIAKKVSTTLIIFRLTHQGVQGIQRLVEK